MAEAYRKVVEPEVSNISLLSRNADFDKIKEIYGKLCINENILGIYMIYLMSSSWIVM